MLLIKVSGEFCTTGFTANLLCQNFSTPFTFIFSPFTLSTGPVIKSVLPSLPPNTLFVAPPPVKILTSSLPEGSNTTTPKPLLMYIFQRSSIDIPSPPMSVNFFMFDSDPSALISNTHVPPILSPAHLFRYSFFPSGVPTTPLGHESASHSD